MPDTVTLANASKKYLVLSLEHPDFQGTFKFTRVIQARKIGEVSGLRREQKKIGGSIRFQPHGEKGDTLKDLKASVLECADVKAAIACGDIVQPSAKAKAEAKAKADAKAKAEAKAKADKAAAEAAAAKE
jgi:hypothetical protein